MSAKSANVQANAICPKISFVFIGMGICYFSNKPFCTFGQIVATLDCPVRSSYPQLHGIVNLIQILQGGLEIVLLSWRTFLLTDLHSPVHLWSVSCLFVSSWKPRFLVDSRLLVKEHVANIAKKKFFFWKILYFLGVDFYVDF